MSLERGEQTLDHAVKRMLRYILVFAILFVLGVVACVAASAADAPAVGQVAFAVSLGLFVAALAGGVVRSQRHPQK